VSDRDADLPPDTRVARSRLIAPVGGFAPYVGALLSMMRLVRQDTLALARGISNEELADRREGTKNTIGMLLSHVAALECITVLRHLERRDPTDEERAWLQPRMELGHAGFAVLRTVSGAEIEEDLRRTRASLERSLLKIDDAAFGEPFLWRGVEVNMHRQVFHVMEDELRHVGQIRWLLKRMRGE